MWAPTSEPFSSTQTESIGRQLLQADGGGEAGRAGAHDHDIIFHRFALNLFHRQFSVYRLRFRVFIVAGPPAQATNSDMQTKQNDMTPREAAAALRWLIDMGADEIIGETPVNRLAGRLRPARSRRRRRACRSPPRRPAPRCALAAPAAMPGQRRHACQTLADIAAALTASTPAR